MKITRKAVFVVLALAASAVALAQTVNCPKDRSAAFFTGQTTVDVSGKQLRLYKCMAFGHEFWVPAY